MTDIAKLKAAAEKAKDNFIPNFMVSTRDVLELIAALHGFQRANAAQDDHINQQQDRIDKLEKGHQEAAKQINSWRRIAKENIAEREKDIAALDEARKRIAELESRAVKLPDNCEHDVMAPVASFMYEEGYEFDGEDYSALAGRVRSELETVLRRSLRAAGINLETWGE